MATFDELVMAKAGVCGEGFAPSVHYDPDGDCIEFLATPDTYYAERIDKLVTVFRRHEDGEIIGSLIKGVRRLCESLLKRFPGFAISIKEGRVRLEHLFLAELWTQDSPPDEPQQRTYRKLIEVAERTHAEAEVCLSSD